MKLKNTSLLFLVILVSLTVPGCSDDSNHTEYYPGPNGEKPDEFIYSLSKEYEIAEADAQTFIEMIEAFASENSMYKGEPANKHNGVNSVYFIAGPPMKFLLRVEYLRGSRFRVQISNYPGRACSLCDIFIRDVESKISKGL